MSSATSPATVVIGLCLRTSRTDANYARFSPSDPHEAFPIVLPIRTGFESLLCRKDC